MSKIIKFKSEVLALSNAVKMNLLSGIADASVEAYVRIDIDGYQRYQFIATYICKGLTQQKHINISSEIRAQQLNADFVSSSFHFILLTNQNHRLLQADIRFHRSQF